MPLERHFFLDGDTVEVKAWILGDLHRFSITREAINDFLRTDDVGGDAVLRNLGDNWDRFLPIFERMARENHRGIGLITSETIGLL